MISSNQVSHLKFCIHFPFLVCHKILILFHFCSTKSFSFLNVWINWMLSWLWMRGAKPPHLHASAWHGSWSTRDSFVCTLTLLLRPPPPHTHVLGYRVGTDDALLRIWLLQRVGTDKHFNARLALLLLCGLKQSSKRLCKKGVVQIVQ
jgi:hypothetical protein